MITRLIQSFLSLFLFCALSNNSYAQVTIGSGSPPKATLEVTVESMTPSTPAGVIAPRVSLGFLGINEAYYTEEQKGAIIYINEIDVVGTGKTENIKQTGYYYFDGSVWLQFVIPEAVTIPTEPWRVAETGNEATQNDQNIYQNGQVTIGKVGAGEASAQLDISSSDKGFLIPRLYQKQRDQIANPAQSLMIWNIDEECFNFWRGGKWRSLCGDLGEATIKITPADCAAATVEGQYKVGVPTTSANYVEVTLQVEEPGSFTIEGKTGAGFFFQRIGTFSEKGTYTIQLQGMGAPDMTGTDGTVPLSLYINGVEANPSCTGRVIVAPADAKFNFISSSCGSTATDYLIKGEPAIGQKISAQIEVTTAGTFNFETIANSTGVKYTLSNAKLAVGTHTIDLTASGTPLVSGDQVLFEITGTGLVGNTCNSFVAINVNEAELTASCGSATVSGVYRLDFPTTASHYIDIPVTWTNIGTWEGTAVNNEAGISFHGSGTVNATGSQTIRLYAEGTPIVVGTKTFTITINDLTCSVDVTIVIPAKKILIVGPDSGSYLTTALENSTNFSPTGISKVEALQVKSISNPSASTLISEINSGEIDIIIAGGSFHPNEETSSVIADFIKNKKGYFLQYQSQDHQTYLERIINKAYGLNVSLTEDELSIRLAKLIVEDNIMLNGVFGDARGKIVRSDDAASWIGMTPADEQSANGIFKSLLQLPQRSSYPARNLFSYATGFFMIPDWGQITGTGIRGTNAPIGFNTSGTETLDGWDGSSYQSSMRATIGDVANWVLFGNAMDHAIKYVQENIRRDYLVDTNYSN